MQAVILVAGNGTRLRPITNHVPKPMIKIGNKTLLEYNIDNLPSEVDEIIFVVGYLGEQIKDYFGSEFKGKKVKYVEQKELLGTGHAIKQCEDILDKRFIVMMGDDIYHKDDMKKCLQHDRCMLVKEVEGKFCGGKIMLNEEGVLDYIKEGKHENGNCLVNTAFYVMTDDFFNYDLVKIKGCNEYGLPQTLAKAAKDYPVSIEKATTWLQVTDIDSLKKAEVVLTKKP